MSRLLSRIMLALLMLPMAAIVYLVVYFTLYEMSVFDRITNDEIGFFLTDLVTAVFVAGYWTLLWRKSVKWTSRRIKLTLLAAVLAILIGICLGAMLAILEDSFGVFVGGITTILLWLTFTVFIWRESKQERASRISVSNLQVVVCPDCGYNLTGLRQTTCPECGSSYTINELLASQPGRESIEIEH